MDTAHYIVNAVGWPAMFLLGLWHGRMLERWHKSRRR